MNGEHSNTKETLTTEQQARIELLTDELSELLYEIGWRPTADAQWDNLKANIGRLQTVIGKAAKAHPCVECGWLKSRQIEVKS